MCIWYNSITQKKRNKFNKMNVHTFAPSESNLSASGKQRSEFEISAKFCQTFSHFFLFLIFANLF